MNLTVVILAALICFSISYDKAMLIAWYKKGSVSLPLLNQAILRRYMPYWIVTLATRVLAISARLAYARYNLVVIVSSLGSYIITVLAVIIFLFQDNLFTALFILRLRAMGVDLKWLLVALVALMLLGLSSALIRYYHRIRSYFLLSK